MNDDLISRQAAIDEVKQFYRKYDNDLLELLVYRLEQLPPAQPEYEELTPVEVASEIASGSIISASYWLDVMIALKQMGYAICRKKG